MADINGISRDIIGAAMRIHKMLGPGLFESVYVTLLSDAVERIGYFVEREKQIPIEFEGRKFQKAFYADLFIQGCVLVECKSSATITALDFKQTLTYVRLIPCHLGLILNFGAESLGIKRVVN